MLSPGWSSASSADLVGMPGDCRGKVGQGIRRYGFGESRSRVEEEGVWVGGIWCVWGYFCCVVLVFCFSFILFSMWIVGVALLGIGVLGWIERMGGGLVTCHGVLVFRDFPLGHNFASCIYVLF